MLQRGSAWRRAAARERCASGCALDWQSDHGKGHVAMHGVCMQLPTAHLVCKGI